MIEMERIMVHGKPSKAVATREFITKLAYSLGPGGKLPPVRELCKQANVANVTLANALAELEDFGIIQRRHGSGIYVSDGIQEKNVGLVLGRNVFGETASPVFRHLVQFIQNQSPRGMHHSVFFLNLTEPSNEQSKIPGDLFEVIRKQRLHGLMLVGQQNDQEIETVRQYGLPVVGFSIHKSQPLSVSTSYESIAYLGVHSLAELGCKRIALISQFGWMRNSFQDDLAGFKSGLKKCSLEFHDDLIVSSETEIPPRDYEIFGFKAIELLWSKQPRIDGVVILDDIMTRGAILALHKLGVGIGTKLQIASHANKDSTMLSSIQDNLVLLEIDPEEVADAMIDLLRDAMGGKAGANRVILPKVIMHSKRRRKFSVTPM